MIPQIFFFKNIAWNLPVECVKHENVGSGRFSLRFLPGFQVVYLFLTLNMVPLMIVPLYIDIEQTVIHLGMLWKGIWVHPQANIAPEVGILLAKLGFWWVFLLFCLLLGPPNPLRLHPTSISYVCKCFSTLICCGWAYADTPPESYQSQFSDILEWGPTYLMWLHHG